MYDPRVKKRSQVQELMTDLSFPNGVELSKDESYLLVAEGARARIYRLGLQELTLSKHGYLLMAEGARLTGTYSLQIWLFSHGNGR